MALQVNHSLSFDHGLRARLQVRLYKIDIPVDLSNLSLSVVGCPAVRRICGVTRK